MKSFLKKMLADAEKITDEKKQSDFFKRELAKYEDQITDEDLEEVDKEMNRLFDQLDKELTKLEKQQKNKKPKK